MDKKIIEKFGKDTKELKLLNENNAKWAIGVTIGNMISKVGLLSGGVKPKYYLVGNKIIRYTLENHHEIAIDSFDEKSGEYTTQSGVFILK